MSVSLLYMSDQKPDPTGEHVIHITQLRDCLGVAYSHVKQTGEPIIIQRYNDPEVAMVPLWEWRFLKEVEAKIRAGQCPWEEEQHDPNDG